MKTIWARCIQSWLGRRDIVLAGLLSVLAASVGGAWQCTGQQYSHSSDLWHLSLHLCSPCRCLLLLVLCPLSVHVPCMLVLILCPCFACRSAGPPSQPQRPPQPRSRQAADPFADSGSLQAVPAHQQPADPFAEPGSSMPARQVPGQQAGTDDFLDMFQGPAAAPSGARPGAAAAPTGGGDDDLLGGFAGSLGES